MFTNKQYSHSVLLFLIVFVPVKFSFGYDEHDSTTFRVNGYIKSLTQVNQSVAPDTIIAGELLHQRTSMVYKPNKKLQLRLDARTRLFYGDIFKSEAFRSGLDDKNELINLDAFIIENKQVLLLLQIDRAYIDYQSEKIGIRLGEQRINWGTNLIWNPNDIFNTYNILDFDYEERNGVQAIRLEQRLSDRKTLEIAAAPGKDSTSTYGLQYKTFFKTYDLQFSLGSLHGQSVIGCGWAGNIGSLGFKGEFNHYFKQGETTEQSLAATTIDYTTKNGWYIFGSALYQRVLPESYVFSNYSQNSSFTAKYLMPGNWSVYTGGSKELSPLTTLQLAVIYTNEMNTLVLFPSFSYAMVENLELLATFQCALDDQRAAWKYYGTAGFIRLKYSF